MLFFFSFSRLQLEFTLRQLDLGRSRVVHEPDELTRSDWPHSRGRQAELGGVQDIGQNLYLARAGGDERDARGVVDDGEGERHATRWRLGRVLDVRHPAIVLRQELVSREERGRVAVGADAEEDEVKDGEARRVPLGELLDELLLVRVRELLEVVQLRLVDRVDVVARDGHFGEERVEREFVVGIFMVEGHDAFVGVEDVPMWGRVDRKEGCMGERRVTCHLSHCTPGLETRAVSVLGRDPPEMATVNLLRLSMDSF